MKLTKALTAVALGTLCAGAMASSNLVSNGSFEQLALSDGYSATVRSVSGWTLGGTTATVINPISGSKYEAGTTGQNFLGLFNGSSIYTALSTVAGNTYTLSFDWDSSRGASVYGLWGATGSNVMGALRGNASDNWLTRTVTFTALGATTYLGFAAAPGSFLRLDNVRVAPPVPEPASVALFLAGIGALGIVSRRRRVNR